MARVRVGVRDSVRVRVRDRDTVRKMASQQISTNTHHSLPTTTYSLLTVGQRAPQQYLESTHPRRHPWIAVEPRYSKGLGAHLVGVRDRVRVGGQVWG